jgi:hypothetical protein
VESVKSVVNTFLAQENRSRTADDADDTDEENLDGAAARTVPVRSGHVNGDALELAMP